MPQEPQLLLQRKYPKHNDVAELVVRWRRSQPKNPKTENSKQKTVAKSVAMLSNSKLLFGVSNTDFDCSKIARRSASEPI